MKYVNRYIVECLLIETGVKMVKAGCLTITKELLKRRHFLQVGSLSLLGINLSQYLELKTLMAESDNDLKRKATAEACVVIWLEGGPSQVDTWDPKPNSNFKPISTNIPGIQISELLPKIAKHMDKLALVRSVHTKENNHGQGTYYALTGHRPTAAMKFPSLGTIVTKELGARNNIPANVLVPDAWKSASYGEYIKGAFLDPAFNPMIVPDPSKEDFQVSDLALPKTLTVERLHHRQSMLNLVDQIYRSKIKRIEHQAMDKFSEQALQMILTPEARAAFDLSTESEKTKDAYGRGSFGQSLLLTRRLIEAGSRFVTAAGHELNGWDTHSDNDQRHKEKMTPGLDKALPVFLEDLKQRGLFETTIVVVMGEFGRSPHHNSKLGRDHWPHCWSLAIGGGGIKGGQVIGASDDRGAYVAERTVSMGDIYATIYKALGIDWHKEYMSPIGRPVKIANALDDETGQPIKGLI